MSVERAAIVTGASSGIGLAISRMLGEEGFGVTMAARRPDKLDGGGGAESVSISILPEIWPPSSIRILP